MARPGAGLSDVAIDLCLGSLYGLKGPAAGYGVRGLFLFDQEEWLGVVSAFARGEELSGSHFQLTRRTRFGSVGSVTPRHITARAADSVRSWWTPQLRLSATEPLQAIVEALNKWQPEVMTTFPSVASELAQEQEVGRLNIQPRRIFTGAEPLFPEWRARIESAWGRCVFDMYGATEMGAFASECQEERRMHLLEDLFVAEVVDASNRPVPDGDLGDKWLPTPFNRTTLPMLRYEISDCIQISPEPCPCGRPFRVIEKIQGRVEDLIPLPGMAGGMVNIRGAYLEAERRDSNSRPSSWQGQGCGKREFPRTDRNLGAVLGVPRVGEAILARLLSGGQASNLD